MKDHDLWKAYVDGVVPLGEAPQTAPLRPISLPRRRDVPLVPPVLDGSHGSLCHVSRKRLERPHCEGTLDLHGLTQARAYEALYRFVEGSYHRGRRVVLVITGKGLKAEAEGREVLKSLVPHWLDQGALRAYLWAYHPAHAIDGGSGALYVYLKKNRLI